MHFPISETKISLIGLGYVGMPLALALAKHFPVTGFDISEARVSELQNNHDRNREISKNDLAASSCRFTTAENDLAGHNLFIVTVPTPLKEPGTEPDLSLVESACEIVGRYLSKGSVVVFESTVYPGVTEDICGPVLERVSGLKAGQDFWLGYSPERINPGDTQHTVDRITKVVAGQTPGITDLLAEIYGKTNKGNIFKARDIKTAEASKVIENAQRDINVAFINEVTQILHKLGLNMTDVLEAAATKWNFLPFRPGLVGGHCIGVDPYYLSYCAQNMGHDPQVILSGRRINDGMGKYFANRLHDLLEKKAGKILVLGFTFKENINDIRNTKVMDVISALKECGHDVDIHDPHADADEVRHHYGLEILSALPAKEEYDAAVLAVPHSEYGQSGPACLMNILKTEGLIYDLKGLWSGHDSARKWRYITV